MPSYIMILFIPQKSLAPCENVLEIERCDMLEELCHESFLFLDDAHSIYVVKTAFFAITMLSREKFVATTVKLQQLQFQNQLNQWPDKQRGDLRNDCLHPFSETL